MACKCGSKTAPQQTAVNYRRATPDGMRRGGFNYEVVGDDYAASVMYGVGTLFTAPTITNPESNQANTGYSPYVPKAVPAVRKDLPQVIRQMPPLYYDTPKFMGFVGVNLVSNNKPAPLVYAPGYDGIMPIQQQPKIDKPYPYLTGAHK